VETPALKILIVEADPAKEYLLETTVASCGLAASVRRVQGVDQAIAYLSGKGGFADRRGFPLPAVILLDLHLPDGPGVTVLEWLMEHGRALEAAVVVICDSREEEDVKRAAALRAHSYLVKPITPDALCEKIQSVWPL
jgi:CheY-like chemotaxis protein